MCHMGVNHIEGFYRVFEAQSSGLWNWPLPKRVESTLFTILKGVLGSYVWPGLMKLIASE